MCDPIDNMLTQMSGAMTGDVERLCDVRHNVYQSDNITCLSQ